MATMPEPWRRSQAAKYGTIGLAPTEWLARWRNPDPTPRTDGGASGEMVDLSRFWDILQRDGFKDPILMRVCVRTGHGRLEAGNHRCLLAERHSLRVLPCVVQLGVGPVGNVGNGDYAFDMRPELVAWPLPDVGFEAMTAPQNVFKAAWPMD